VWDFGVECSKSENWSAKVPLILVESISDAADLDPGVYDRDEVWDRDVFVRNQYVEMTKLTAANGR
jgi:hypothetical protein